MIVDFNVLFYIILPNTLACKRMHIRFPGTWEAQPVALMMANAKIYSLISSYMSASDGQREEREK